MTVRRVWPRGDDVVLEVVDDSGFVRAGHRNGDGAVTVNAPGVDEGLAGLPAAVRCVGGPGHVVGHRLGRRCVLRGDGCWVKVMRRSKLTDARERHRKAASLLRGTAVEVPQLLDSCEEPGVMVLGHMEGVTLFERNDPVGAAALVGVALGNWQCLVPAPGLDIHDATEERKVLATWAGHATRHGVFDAPARALFEALRAVADRALGTLGDRPLVFTHRDLHDAQVLLDGNRVGVLDWDTAALADPALDLANLMAHVELAHAAGRIDAYTADAVNETLRSSWRWEGAGHEMALQAYHAAARVRLAAVHAFRPSTRGAASRLLAR